MRTIPMAVLMIPMTRDFIVLVTVRECSTGSNGDGQHQENDASLKALKST